MSMPTAKTSTQRKPEIVALVYRAMLDNAKEAGLKADAVYCGFHPASANSPAEWVIGSNREDGSSAMVYCEDKWFYREPLEGTDSPVKGGMAEVLGNTRCFFTG